MTDRRLIEAGFPCHQVGAETARERGASNVMPPIYYLHVWWARRPLTPSRAAIEASLLPETADTEEFVRTLGIEQKVADIDGVKWILTGDITKLINHDETGEYLVVDEKVQNRFEKEKQRRNSDIEVIQTLKNALDAGQQTYPEIETWEQLSKAFPIEALPFGKRIEVSRQMANPAWFNRLMNLAKSVSVRVPNLYGYDRAYQNDYSPKPTGLTVLDPTAGGGSIPFEALRLGHNVIANELNPVASTILHATLDYPSKYGVDIVPSIRKWGEKIIKSVDSKMANFFGDGQDIPDTEKEKLLKLVNNDSELARPFLKEQITTFLYCREVTCPSCLAKTPLLNTFWLAKSDKNQWGIRVVSNGVGSEAKYSFETYNAKSGKGPNGEDPEQGTCKRGIGQCVHCKQAIEASEIKDQATGESVHNQWKDRVYAIAAFREQPKVDNNGAIQKYASGEKKGQVKTETVRYFRTPSEKDHSLLSAASEELSIKWDYYDELGLIPTEPFPKGNDLRPIRYGMERWHKLFNDRQLLSHLCMVESLQQFKEEILTELGPQKGRAVITYLQFAHDKTLDYNSRQTRWEFTRGVVKGTFGRHDFSLKWTYGEMIFSGPNSGSQWGLNQATKACRELSELLASSKVNRKEGQSLQIINGSAAYIEGVPDKSVDMVCMDPPYYDNVQYAELSDYFYVWQKRTLKDLYPDISWPRLTNKQEEAVANPARDGSAKNAKAEYEKLMGEIFAESRRVVKDDGVMTLMFTHKAQDAWETLTRSLIESGWEITSCFPVESESGYSTHQMNMASAASTIFITCRKRALNDQQVAFWSGLGGTGIQHQIRSAVEAGLDEFRPLKLNAVDQMIACYGRALQVLSENWPVMDGDEEVSPIRAMNEASRVVAEHQIKVITDGNISVDDLDTETAMALTMYGIWGHNEASFTEVLNLSRSLNISLETRTGGYGIEGRMVGINTEISGRTAVAGQAAEDKGYAAPLVKKGSKLRLAKPQERSARRVAKPQSDWDVLHGLLLKFREGDVPVARAYLDEQREGNDNIILDLLEVWGEEAETPEARNEAQALLFGLRQQ